MAEEPNPSSQETIKMEGTARDESKLTQVGSIKAENFNLTAEQVQFIVQLERINKPESPGVLKVGDSPISLAYWQGRKTEIAQINQWLTDENTFLIGIEGIGGTGKSMLAAWEKTGEKENPNYGAALNNLGNAYNSLGQYQQAIKFLEQSKQIATEIGDRNTEGKAIANLGLAYSSQGQYQQAIELFQQSKQIAREICDRNTEANVWFNLAQALENLNRESDALGAYRNARELCQAMGLDANVQDCNNAIERLSQPQMPVVPHRGFWGWLRRLWRWVCGWFRQ